MAVLKFDEVPYENVKEGLQRKIIHTGKLMSVLIDFTNGPWRYVCRSAYKKHTVKLHTEKVRLIDSFTPLREDFL